MEDSQLAENEFVFKTVMLYANGAGRPRSNINITISKTNSWCGHCLSTGERAISDVSGYGGCTARTIEIMRKKYKNYSAVDFSSLRMTLNENFGFGEEVINFWFARKSEIIKKYEEMLMALEKYFASAEDTKKMRVLPNLAIICVGAWIAEQIWGFYYSWDNLCNEIITLMGNKPSSGSEKLYEELCALQQCYADRIGLMIGKAYGPDKIQYRYSGNSEGKIVKNELAIYHPGLNALCFHGPALEVYLEGRGYGLSQVTGILLEKGLLITDGKHRQIKITVNSQKIWVYAIKLPNATQDDGDIFTKSEGK